MKKEQRLFTPGPTPLPPQVFAAMSVPPLHHRTAEAKTIHRSVNERLQRIFMTAQPVLTLTSSGTGAVEAAITNCFSAGEKGICINNGKFAARWGEMMSSFGMNVVNLDIPWGEAATPEDLMPLLKEHADAVCVWMVQSETSTGVWTDVEALARLIREESNALCCVDGVTSIGCHECKMDEWGIDILFTGSQKGLMAPPGLAFIALSERAWRRTSRNSLPSYYFNLAKARHEYDKNTTPWTPAITLVQGVNAALTLIEEEGLENVWRRHEANSYLLRSIATRIGLSVFGKQPSHAVTSLLLPEQCRNIVALLAQRFGIIVAAGQDGVKEKIFRVGHLGYYDELDIRTIGAALEAILTDTQGMTAEELL